MTCERENVLRRCLNISSDGADVICDGRLLQKLAPETVHQAMFIYLISGRKQCSWVCKIIEFHCKALNEQQNTGTSTSCVILWHCSIYLVTSTACKIRDHLTRTGTEWDQVVQTVAVMSDVWV